MSKNVVTRLNERLNLQKSLCALVAFFAIASLSACTNFFGDSKRSSAHMKVQSGMSCFDQASETVSDYVDGKVPLAQMDTLLDCTVKSVDEFTEKVRGSSGKPNSYNRSDITIFLDQFLLTTGKFDHKLLAVLFDLKASSIGGDENSISPADIEKLKALLVDVKTSLHDVDPYLGLLTRRESIDPHSTEDQKKFELAVKAFRTAITRLTPYFAPSGLRQKTFTMEESFDLMASLGLDMKKYEQYKDLSRMGKQVLVGGDSDTILAEQWLTLIKRAIDGYELYLRYQTYIEPLPMTDAVVTPQLHVIADEALAFISKSVNRQDGHVLTEDQLKKIVLGLDTAQLLPKRITAQAILDFIPTVVEKWALDRSVALPVSSKGIGLPELATLTYYTQNWLDGMDVLVSVTTEPTVTQTQVRKALAEVAAKPMAIGELAVNQVRKATVLGEWNQIFGQGREWAWNNNHYIIVAPQDSLPRLRANDLFRMNIWRAGVEAVLRIYATDYVRAKTLAGLTSDEVQQVYVDIRGISHDLDLIDPRTFDAGSRTFMETNLFTSNANGDSLMQYREGIDWINSAMSATSQASAVYNDIAKHCAPTAQNDILGHRQMEDACFRAGLRQGFVNYFPNFPNAISFFKSKLQDDKSWTEFITAFETIARPQGPVPGPIDIGAARTLVTVLGYNESLFLRFDADHDQLLTNDELWKAYPLVQPLIQEAMAKPFEAPVVRGQCVAAPLAPPAAPASAGWLQEAVFAYLVQNGHPPPTSGIKALGVPWAFAKSYVLKAKLTRLDLIKIIASFTAVTSQKKLDSITAFYQAQQPTLRSDLESGVCSIVQKTLTLFKCDPTALAPFVKMARAKDSLIFGGSIAETPDQFRQAMEQQLQNDPALRGVCSPF